MWTRKTTAKVTVLGRKVITEESDIVKKIQRNNTREKEIVQALEKNNGLAWGKKIEWHTWKEEFMCQITKNLGKEF